MNTKLAVIAAICAALLMASPTDAEAAKRQRTPTATPSKQCTYTACYTKCVEQGGGRNAGGRPAISCSRECENPCAH